VTEGDKMNEALLYCNGNSYAAECLVKIGKLFRIWDDVWDGDKKHEKEEFDSAFADFSFDLGRNQFFRRHRDVLEAHIFLSWNAWKDSNVWRDSGSKMQKLNAWFIRDYCNEIVPLMAWLTGGKDFARKVSLGVREKYLNELIAGGIDGFI
jgi:hypothetical protein